MKDSNIRDGLGMSFPWEGQLLLQEDGVEGRGHQLFMDLEFVCQFIVLYDSWPTFENLDSLCVTGQMSFSLYMSPIMSTITHHLSLPYYFSEHLLCFVF